MTPRLRITAAVLALAAAAPARAAKFAGARPFDFLFLDAGALQAGMGGAFAAGGGDANVMAYNPAGLARMEATHAAFMYTSHFQDARRHRLALATRWGLGLSYDSLSYGAVGRTTLSDPDGAALGAFTPVSRSMAAGFGFPLGERITLGAAVKRISEDIDDARARATAWDFGAQIDLLDAPAWRVGAALQNAGGAVTFQTESEELPTNIRWGTAVQGEFFGRPVAFLADAAQDPKGRTFLHLGFNMTAAQVLSLRLGYNTRNDAGPGVSGGFGIRLGSADFDYALVPFGPLGFSHQVTLGFSWGPRPLAPAFSGP